MLASIALTEEQKRELNKLDDIALSLENNKKSKESQIDDIEKELAKEKNMYIAQKAAILSYTANFSGLLTNVSKLDNTRNPIKRAYIHRLIKKELINQGISFDGKTRKDKRIKKSEFVKRLSAQNHIIGEAIKKADKKYKGFPLYSGQWTINLNEKGMIGKTITWNKPTSTSKSPDVARKFSKRPVAGFTNFALFEIKATGKNGLDLTQGANDVGKVDKDPMNLSVFGFDEQEVLFAPGTKLKITDVIKNVDITNYKRTINKTKLNDENPDEINYYRWKEQKIKNEEGNEETIQVRVGNKVGTLIKCKEV